MSYADTLLDSDLQEVLADQPAPDLRDRTLQRLTARLSPPVPDVGETPRARRFSPRMIAQAAGIALVLGLIGWLVTRSDRLPTTVVPADGADYRVTAAGVELRQGWLLLTEGAPTITCGNTRIEAGNGRAVVGTDLPDNQTLYALAETLPLEPKERAMFTNAKRWITAGALTLCLFSGHLIVNGQRVESEPKTEVPPETPKEDQVRVELPKADDIPGVKALLGKVTGAYMRTIVDDSWNWSGWYGIDAADTQKLHKTLADNVITKTDKPAGFDHGNIFGLTLSDGRVMRASVYTYGRRLDLSLPGVEGWTQYDTGPDLWKSVEPWLSKAAKIARVPDKDAAAMRVQLAFAHRVDLRDDFDKDKPKAGVLTTANSVKQLIEVLWRNDLTETTDDDAKARVVFQFTFQMPEDEKVVFEVCDNGFVAMKIAGAKDLVLRILPEGGTKSVHDMLTPFAKADPPIDDPAAMRELLAGAERIDFIKAATGPDAARLGAIESTVVLATLAALLWPDNIAEAKVANGQLERAYSLKFTHPVSGKFEIELMKTGFLRLNWPGRGGWEVRLLPNGSIAKIADLLDHHLVRSAPEMRVLRQWAGPDSKINTARGVIVTKGADWKSLWAEHAPGEVPPEIDFDLEMAIALFAGSTWNSRGYYVEYFLRGDNDGVVMRVNQRSYQSSGGADRVTPFGIFVIPRTEHTVIVEENVQDLIGKAPLWKALAARVEFVSEPPKDVYKPAKSWVGKGGTGESKFCYARDMDEWLILLGNVPLFKVELPKIDWDKQIAIAVTGEILAGLGDFSLSYVGANGTCTVLRLTKPIAQTMGQPVTESHYALWVLPKPLGELVIETPQYGLIGETPKWSETHTVKLK